MKTKAKKKKPEVFSVIKDEWVEIKNKDWSYWFGQYLLASMVIKAHKPEYGIPSRVGKIQDMKTNKDGSGTIPFQAEWD